MKFTKSRDSCFVVLRTVFNPATGLDDVYPVGVFASIEAADNYAGACEQEWADKGYSINDVFFHTEATIYYG